MYCLLCCLFFLFSFCLFTSLFCRFSLRCSVCLALFVCCALCFCSSFFFFVFNPKTAYEMRISDWSSDVCSSDLDPRRVTPSGAPYQPFHDVQAIVDGEAAALLGEIARERWHTAKGVDLGPLQPEGDPWPAELKPDMTDVDVGVARTLPEFEKRKEVREVERLYLDTIAHAEKLIYAENQYFTAMTVAKAIAQRLAVPDGPEVVLIGPKEGKGWMEREVMDRGRAAFVEYLRKADKYGRLRVFYQIGRASWRARVCQYV